MKCVHEDETFRKPRRGHREVGRREGSRRGEAGRVGGLEGCRKQGGFRELESKPASQPGDRKDASAIFLWRVSGRRRNKTTASETLFVT